MATLGAFSKKIPDVVRDDIYQGIKSATWNTTKRASIWSAKAVGRGVLKLGKFTGRALIDTLKLGAGTALQAGDIIHNFGMGGKPLFYEVENPAILKGIKRLDWLKDTKYTGWSTPKPGVINEYRTYVSNKAIALQETRLKNLGWNPKNPNSTKHLTFNETLRKRIVGAAVGIAVLGSLKESFSYQDPRVPVYDETPSTRNKYDMGHQGLPLAQYYNSR